MALSSGDALEDITEGWEHVSVSKHKNFKKNFMPTWDDMCFIKDLFWDSEDTVIQFHPKKSQYINNHPMTLHLWKKRSIDHELPPSITVGILYENSKRK